MATAYGTPPVGEEPTEMICPHCHNQITSEVESAPTARTHLFFILLCVIGCWFCAPFVYCAKGCLIKKHTCPKCKGYLGTYDH